MRSHKGRKHIRFIKIQSTVIPCCKMKKIQNMFNQLLYPHTQNSSDLHKKKTGHSSV
jgi:hypothetical protein